MRGHCFNYEVNYKVSSGLVFTFISSTSLGAARCMQSEPFQDAETDIFNLFHSVDHFEETNALSFMTGNYMKLKATQITTFSLAPHNFLTATISTVVTNYEFYHHTVDCEISFPYYAYGANEIYFGVPDSSISN